MLVARVHVYIQGSFWGGGGTRGFSPLPQNFILAVTHMHNFNRLICVLYSETASSDLKWPEISHYEA